MSFKPSLKMQRDYYASMSYARKKGFEEGFKEGFEEGLKKSIKEWKLDIVKKLIIGYDFTDEKIAKGVDVPIDLVRKARKGIEKK